MSLETEGLCDALLQDPFDLAAERDMFDQLMNGELPPVAEPVSHPVFEDIDESGSAYVFPPPLSPVEESVAASANDVVPSVAGTSSDPATVVPPPRPRRIRIVTRVSVRFEKFVGGSSNIPEVAWFSSPGSAEALPAPAETPLPSSSDADAPKLTKELDLDLMQTLLHVCTLPTDLPSTEILSALRRTLAGKGRNEIDKKIAGAARLWRPLPRKPAHEKEEPVQLSFEKDRPWSKAKRDLYNALKDLDYTPVPVGRWKLSTQAENVTSRTKNVGPRSDLRKVASEGVFRIPAVPQRRKRKRANCKEEKIPQKRIPVLKNTRTWPGTGGGNDGGPESVTKITNVPDPEEMIRSHRVVFVKFLNMSMPGVMLC